MATVNYLVYESAVGYALFKVAHNADAVGLNLPEVKKAMRKLDSFGKMLTLQGFRSWVSAAEGLQSINELSEGVLPENLRTFLELELPNPGKKSKIVLGILDKRLASDIAAAFPSGGLQCEAAETSDVVATLLRGVRVHAEKLLTALMAGDMQRAQTGLTHAYSRSKVKFNVHKQDNQIIQGIAALDTLDKGVNSGGMRVREWYGWHFPELHRIVTDNVTYAGTVLFIATSVGDKKHLNDEHLDSLADVLNQDSEKGQAIIQAAKVSMGQDISDMDLGMIKDLASNVVKMSQYRCLLSGSLDNKMGEVAPNLQVILGTPVAARLISHAGSLTNLAKYPASTLQILGAEKALFRALKTKGATPKYGLLFHSTYITRAAPKIRGRISRYLANKCSIASRIDNFTEVPTKRFGEALREQLEERLRWYTTGAKPMKNEDAMHNAIKAVMEDNMEGLAIDPEMLDHPGPEKTKKTEKEKKKKRKSAGVDVEMTDVLMDGDEKKHKKEKKDKKDKDKKEKKDKKRKSAGEDIEMTPVDGDAEPKKKKKRRSASVE